MQRSLLESRSDFADSDGLRECIYRVTTRMQQSSVIGISYRRAHHKWSTQFVSRTVRNRKLRSAPPRMALRHPGNK